MTPRRHPAPVLGTEIPEAYTPTEEDLREMGDHFARFSLPVGPDPCPWCGQDVLVGDDSDQIGEQVFHSRCMREMVEEELR